MDIKETLLYAVKIGNIDDISNIFNNNNISLGIYFSVLYQACKYGYVDIVSFIINNNTFTYRLGLHKAFMKVCKYGHMDIANYLYNNTKVELCDEYVIEASKYGHLELVKYLLDLHKFTKNNQAIKWAFAHGHHDVVKHLLSTIQINTEKRNYIVNLISEYGPDLTAYILLLFADTDIDE